MGRLFTFAMHISIQILYRSLFYYPSGTLLFITIVVSHWLNSLFAISELLLTLYFVNFLCLLFVSESSTDSNELISLLLILTCSQLQ